MIGALATIAAAGAACTLGCASMVPKSQLYGRTFLGTAPGSRKLALTFDDGPSATHTLDLLELLDRHGVKATFFMIGRHVRALPKVAEAVAQAGHVIGNHTFTHPNLIFSSPAKVRHELAECERALTDAVGTHSSLFRPPFGGRRPDVLRLVRQAGLHPVMWSVTAYDWKLKGPDSIVSHVVRQVSGGEVILMHDGGHLAIDTDRSQTVAAVGRVIQHYRDLGFAFVTVPEMMALGQAPDLSH